MGFLGAILHVINHALFKSLLFLGAGAVQHGAGTRDMDRLGGLLRRTPATGGAFLVGACAISGLPPLNGFVSELLIYLGALAGIADPSRSNGMAWVMLCVLVIGGLALIGGLAAACFTKAFGCVFLGEPRGRGNERQRSGSRDARRHADARRRLHRRRAQRAAMAHRAAIERRFHQSRVLSRNARLAERQSRISALRPLRGVLGGFCASRELLLG